jgi:hypothetical protein
MTPAKAQEFFKVHHDARGKVGLFKTNLPGDDTHVQAYPDSAVSYQKSLAKLLNLSNNMKWQPGGHSKYHADLALGGKAINLGTAKQIFGGKATIEKSDVVVALTASKQDLAKMDVFKDFEFVKKAIKDAKLPPGKSIAVTGAKVTIKDISGADIDLLRKAAKAEFEKADANWKKWQPVAK